jgi:hypothetical protein
MHHVTEVSYARPSTARLVIFCLMRAALQHRMLATIWQPPQEIGGIFSDARISRKINEKWDVMPEERSENPRLSNS